MYTKEEIKKVIKLWDSKNINEIADELNLNPSQVQYLALNIRKNGYKLVRKRVVGKFQSLIKEVISELK